MQMLTRGGRLGAPGVIPQRSPLRGGLTGLVLLLGANVLDLAGRCSVPAEARTLHGSFALVVQAAVCCVLLVILACLVRCLFSRGEKLFREPGLPSYLAAHDFRLAPCIERN